MTRLVASTKPAAPGRRTRHAEHRVDDFPPRSTPAVCPRAAQRPRTSGEPALPAARPGAAPGTGRWARSLRPFELALVTVVALALTVTAIRLMLPLFAAAERESMQASLAHLRSGLMLAATVALVRGDDEAIAALQRANPVELSPRPPRRYAGELADQRAADAPRYHWYYDPERHLLAYRVGAVEALVGGAPGIVRARFRVRLAYDDVDGDDRYTPHVDEFTGVRLEAVEPWRWR